LLPLGKVSTPYEGKKKGKGENFHVHSSLYKDRINRERLLLIKQIASLSDDLLPVFKSIHKNYSFFFRHLVDTQ
jgi:hypothetical protein